MNTKLCISILLFAVFGRLDAAPWTLASSTSVDATTVTLDRTAVPMCPRAMIVIDPFTPNSEARPVYGVSSSTLTLQFALKKAHSSGAQVSFIATSQLNAVCYGARGDDSTDDTVAWQAALDDQLVSNGSVWIEGQNRTHRITTPLIMSSVVKIQNTSFRAESTYAPADATNAMLMASQGTVLPFTAATSDLITTPSAHGIPADDIKVMFLNVTGMAGITPGRIYYSRDRTATEFKVSATVGGAAVNITTSGSGTVYCEINSASRVYLRDVRVLGSNITGLTGMDIFIQQPADIWKLRIDDCPVAGLKLGGQDGVFWNFMSVGCGVAVAMDTASFMKFYQFNAEQCNKAVTMNTACASNLFDGVHLEMNNGGGGLSTSTSVAVEMDAGNNNIFRSMQVSMNHADQTVFKTTGLAEEVGYTLQNIAVPGSVDITMIDDADRGVNLKVWSDFRNHLTFWDAPLAPSSDAYPDHAQWSIVGKNGRYVKFGSVDKDMPVFSLRADSDQAGDILEALDTAGAVKLRVLPSGVLVLPTKAGTWTAGELGSIDGAMGIDTTNHKLNFLSGGSVRTAP